jgi:predicted phosphodiesterase
MALPELEPEAFLVVGDTHSDLDYWRKIIAVAVLSQIKVILSVGDLETSDGGDLNFISKLSELLAEFSLTLIFVDGNHDRHSFLRYRVDGRYDRLCELRGNIFYAPRGCRWNWHGVDILAAGGAYSIDREAQERHMVYNPGEIISPVDVERCIQGGGADIVIAHDCPIEVDLATEHKEAFRPRRWTRGNSPETDRNREALSAIVAWARPSVVFHGHYHLDYETAYIGELSGLETRVIGLGANAEPGSMRLVRVGSPTIEVERVD